MSSLLSGPLFPTWASLHGSAASFFEGLPGTALDTAEQKPAPSFLVTDVEAASNLQALGKDKMPT